MKPLIKKVKGSWRVYGNARLRERGLLFTKAFEWCHMRNIKEGNYGVKTKAS